MANKNEAKIKFTADTADLNAAIKDANSEMSSLRAEMKLADAQFQNTGDSAEYMKTKQELLQEALETNKEKQEALSQKLEIAKQIYGEDSTEVQNLERQLTYAQVEEQKLLTDVNNLNDGLGDQAEAADGAGEATDTMAEILVNAGIADMVKEIGEAAVELAESFDDASAAIVEGTGASGEALDDLNESARSAFGQIADSDATLSDAANVLAELNTRFGITGDSAEGMTTKIMNFAQHTGTDGTKAVDSIANITKRWGLDITDVDGLLDDLTTANQSCQMSVDELSGYLSDNSVQFQELGYSTDEALAMLISLSDGGANVGTVMGGMTKAVANLSSTTDDVPGAFKAAIKAIGNCDTVSEALQAQVGDTGKTVEEIFGKKAAQELATNVQNGNLELEKWTQVLEENDGALQSTTENATTMQDSWKQATNNVSMALGQTFAPVISNVVKAVSGVITSIAQVISSSPALQAILVAVTVALTALAAALGISSLIGMVTKAFSLLNTTMMLNPIFLVVTAIAALVAGLVYAYNHCEQFREIVDKAFTAVKEVCIGVFTAVKDFVTEAISTIKNTASNIFGQMQTTISTIFDTIKSVASTVWNGIKTTISTVVNTVKTVVTNVFTAVQTTATTIWNAIKTAVTTAVNGVKTVVTTVFNTVKTVVTTVFTAIQTTASTIWNGIKTAISMAVNTIKTVVTTVFNAVQTVATTVWNAIKTAVTTPINTAKTLVSTAVNGIKSTVTSVFNGLKSSVTSIFNGIKTAITSPITTAKNTLSNLVSGIKNLFSGLHISLPHIKVPHFRISGGEAPWGIAGRGTAPSIGIEWYAKGAILKKATAIGTNTKTGKKMVGGESGYEALAPIDVLQGYVEAAVDNAMAASTIDYDLLGEKIAHACARLNVSLELDGRQMGRMVRGYV